jgi:tetratricopeptide (TPR) repeat protein
MHRAIFVTLLSTAALIAQHPHTAKPGGRAAGLLPGLGNHQHPITTSSPQAQRWFNQGLTLIYAFNHDEAVRSFEKAAQADPKAPMPHWGVALAMGRNINQDPEPEREKAAWDAIQRAQALAANGNQQERDFIAALARRYSSDPKADRKQLARAYRNAMSELTRLYPDNLDAATLYADAMMNLNPWKLWSKDGTPAEGTAEIVAVLESVLRRDPEHIGANHLYIHAVEASRNPERALPSADRLGRLTPGAGHLVHMPSHIYIRTGQHDRAAKANAAAAAADRAYIAATGAKGIYPLMYYSHNLHFEVEAHKFQGRSADALRVARVLEANAAKGVKEMGMLEGFLPTTLFVALRFQRWADILAAPQPDSNLRLMTAFWHYARGVALAATGKAEGAEKERDQFAAIRNGVLPDMPWGLNSAAGVLKIAGHALEARIAEAKGDRRSAIAHWRQAVEAEDALAYDEPPGWYYPVRESLGGALLRDGQFSEAEKVFRADLEQNPRNPRSLFGLLEALRKQERSPEAAWVERQFQEAWRNADVKLRLEDL